MQLNDFEKKHEYLICVDSDGTALDTMNIKHIKCFGPCFVKEWGLDEAALNRWNEINLYEKTRGKNRFITLLIILEEYCKKLGLNLTALREWVQSGNELSNKSLERELTISQDEQLKKALSWSLAVNEEIAKLTAEDKLPFRGVKDCLISVRDFADIAVVSSAGKEALLDEWKRGGIYELAAVLTSQEEGTKEECIHKLLQKGYAPENVLMAGDSFPDLAAAEKCKVWFYPILAGHEAESWNALQSEYAAVFLDGGFDKIQRKLVNQFYKNLNAEA